MMKMKRLEKLPLFDCAPTAAWGSQDASHAADATGRRVFSCPGMGRVLSQCAAKSAAHLSRQPARSPRSQPFPLRLLVLKWKIVSSIPLIWNVKMHHILQLVSNKSKKEVSQISIR